MNEVDNQAFLVQVGHQAVEVLKEGDIEAAVVGVAIGAFEKV